MSINGIGGCPKHKPRGNINLRVYIHEPTDYVANITPVFHGHRIMQKAETTRLYQIIGVCPKHKPRGTYENSEYAISITPERIYGHCDKQKPCANIK